MSQHRADTKLIGIITLLPEAGNSIFNGNVLLNYNKISNDVNYFNYQYSNNDFQPATAVTNRTWQNPEFYYSVNDTSLETSNPNAQADSRLVPVLHIESFNNTSNDAAAIYASTRCNYLTPSPFNGGCVAFVPVVTTTAADTHGGEEAINAIMQIGFSNPLASAQGIEMNQFNNTGSDSLLQDNFTFTRGPYFGISATAGGSNQTVAAFNV